jgi:hypothetical protein
MAVHACFHVRRTLARAPAFRSAAPAPVVAVAPIGEEALEFGGELVGARQIARVDDRLREVDPPCTSRTALRACAAWQ